MSMNEIENKPNHSVPMDQLVAATSIAIENNYVSESLLQRRMAIGYIRAQMIVETLAGCGIVSELGSAKLRSVLITDIVTATAMLSSPNAIMKSCPICGSTQTEHDALSEMFVCLDCNHTWKP
jgi:hypothetical protein